MYAIPVACSIFGVLLFHIAAFGCGTFKESVTTSSHFYNYTFYNTTNSDLGSWRLDYDAPNFFFGFWSYNNHESCVSFPDIVDFAAPFKFGRFVGVAGAILTWIILIVVIIASFFQFPKPKLVFRLTGGGMALVSVFSLLLLVGLLEANTLRLGLGGIRAIISAVIWAGGAVAMIFGMKERPGVTPSTNNASNVTPAVPDTAATTNAVENTANADEEPEITLTETGK
jgi:hypothetical protein